MGWKEVGDEVAKSAPTLGNLVASATNAQGMGVKLLAAILGLGAQTQPEAFLAEVQKPESAAKLIAFEAANLIGLVQLQGSGLPAPVSAMEAVMQNEGRTAFRSAAAVSIVVTIGFFYAFHLLSQGHAAADKGITDDIHLLVGALIAGFTQVISYYLGSSSSSMAKTNLLANSVPKDMVP